MDGWIAMPYVKIKITKEGATADQKAQLIKGVAQLLVDILGKDPETTVVLIDEGETENWGIRGWNRYRQEEEGAVGARTSLTKLLYRFRRSADQEDKKCRFF